MKSNDPYLLYSRDGHVISGIESNDTYLSYSRDGHVISGIVFNDTYLSYSRDGHFISGIHPMIHIYRILGMGILYPGSIQ